MHNRAEVVHLTYRNHPHDMSYYDLEHEYVRLHQPVAGSDGAVTGERLGDGQPISIAAWQVVAIDYVPEEIR